MQIPWAASGYISLSTFFILSCLSEIIEIPSLHPKACLIFLKNYSQDSSFSKSTMKKVREKILPPASCIVAETSMPPYVPIKNMPSTTTISL